MITRRISRDIPNIAIAPAPTITPHTSITHHSGYLNKIITSTIADTIERITDDDIISIPKSNRRNAMENDCGIKRLKIGLNTIAEVYPTAPIIINFINCFLNHLPMIRIKRVMAIIITKKTTRFIGLAESSNACMPASSKGPVTINARL
jgi:hypothetical protein